MKNKYQHLMVGLKPTTTYVVGLKPNQLMLDGGKTNILSLGWFKNTNQISELLVKTS